MKMKGKKKMKIIKNKKIDYINFEDLETGEVFTVDNETYYLKIEEIKMSHENCYINAIALDDGESTCFYNHDTIIPVKTTLIIDED